MQITDSDNDLIKAVFEEYKEEICKEFLIDTNFIAKFNLKNY